MKLKWTVLILGTTLAALSGVGAEAPAASVVAVGRPARTADEAWAELRSLGLLEYRPAGIVEETSVRRQLEMLEQHAQLLREKGLAFFNAFPADPRRWSLVMRMTSLAPRFVVSYAPDIDKQYEAAVATGGIDAPMKARFVAYGAVVVDQAAAAAWKVDLAELNKAMLTAGDLPADVREQQDIRATGSLIRSTLAAANKGQAVDLLSVRENLLTFASQYPESSETTALLRGAMYSFEMAHPPAESAAVWRAFLDFPNQQLAEVAREKVRALELMGEPVELAFTALDGRLVDLQKMRGKVVLIDFWATWCGPCMMEMPTIKKLYAAYHDRGFEVIGISCDYAPVPGVKSNSAKTGPEVLAFTQKEGMLWPQSYEGKKHNEGGNTLATRFAVTGIPAAFLLDQTGKVVASNLRGEKLEAEVKRLLKL